MTTITKKFRYLPAAFLIVVNLFPLYAVLYLDWDLALLLFLYWFEVIIVGLFGVIKIILLINEKEQSLGKLDLLEILLYFGLGFCSLYTIAKILHSTIGFPRMTTSLMIILISLFLSHSLSFVINFIGKKEYKIATPELQLGKFLLRVSMLLFPIFAVQGLILYDVLTSSFIDESVAILALIVLAKVGFDIFSHIFEHSAYLGLQIIYWLILIGFIIGVVLSLYSYFSFMNKIESGRYMLKGEMIEIMDNPSLYVKR